MCVHALWEIFHNFVAAIARIIWVLCFVCTVAWWEIFHNFIAAVAKHVSCAMYGMHCGKISAILLWLFCMVGGKPTRWVRSLRKVDREGGDSGLVVVRHSTTGDGSARAAWRCWDNVRQKRIWGKTQMQTGGTLALPGRHSEPPFAWSAHGIYIVKIYLQYSLDYWSMRKGWQRPIPEWNGCMQAVLWRRRIGKSSGVSGASETSQLWAFQAQRAPVPYTVAGIM